MLKSVFAKVFATLVMSLALWGTSTHAGIIRHVAKPAAKKAAHAAGRVVHTGAHITKTIVY